MLHIRMTYVLYHYWRSSSSWRVRWALMHKKLAFEARHVNLLEQEQQQDAFQMQSPMGHVPCLVVNEHALSESTAIVEWLEEVHPDEPLLPKDPWMRARARQLIQLINAGMQPLHNLAVLQAVSSDIEGQRAWLHRFSHKALTAVERLLLTVASEGPADGPYALGAQFSAADMFVVPAIYTARRWQMDLSRYPRTVAVEVAAQQTEFAKKAHPDAWKP